MTSSGSKMGVPRLHGTLSESICHFQGSFAQPHPMRAVSLCGQQRISCPVVTLTDSAHDLRYVLRLLIPEKGSRRVTSTGTLETDTR